MRNMHYLHEITYSFNREIGTSNDSYRCEVKSRFGAGIRKKKKSQRNLILRVDIPKLYQSGIFAFFVCFTPVHHWTNVKCFSTMVVTSCMEVS